MTQNLADLYRARHENVLTPIATNLERYLTEILRGEPRIDRVSVRAKSLASFVAKAGKVEHDAPKYSAPLLDIQDQIAGRIITFYLSDVERVKQKITEYFGAIEAHRKEPESSSEFGYEGHHYILFLPEEAFQSVDRANAPKVFELQIRTLFQHAWSEGNHDLIYKSLVPLTRDHLRRAAFTAAQAWGADMIFEELSTQLIGNGTSH